MTFDPYTALYERGVAVGHSSIGTDSMTFRFKGELFEFPTSTALGVAQYNGYFYVAPIEAIRKLEAEAVGK